VTRDGTPSPAPTASAGCWQVSAEPVEPSAPSTSVLDRCPASFVLSTVCTRARQGSGVGRGYGVLQLAADREPSPPASASRNRPPPSSSDSDGELSDVTILDLDLYTDAVILGLDRYSDVSEPGSPSAAESLDRTAALASVTLSSSAAEGTSADEPELPPTLDLMELIEVTYEL